MQKNTTTTFALYMSLLTLNNNNIRITNHVRSFEHMIVVYLRERHLKVVVADANCVLLFSRELRNLIKKAAKSFHTMQFWANSNIIGNKKRFERNEREFRCNNISQ